MSVLLALFTSPALCCIRDASLKSLIPDDFALAPQSGHPELLSALPWMRITRILASLPHEQHPPLPDQRGNRIRRKHGAQCPYAETALHRHFGAIAVGQHQYSALIWILSGDVIDPWYHTR